MESEEEEFLECPLCMEEIDITDKYFKPCPCGYQVCRFCWNHIKENINGLCPACRRPYTESDVEFKPVSAQELVRIKTARKKREKDRKEQDMMQRKQLANVRVVQKNLVYVLGLPVRVATEDMLRSSDYFGQYGKITKIVINRRNTPIPSTGVYITFARKDDAANAIENVDGSLCDGRMIRATFGTTKYCSYYLKSQPCQNVGCQFLHETGEEADTYGKDELIRDRQKVFGKKEDDVVALPPTANWYSFAYFRAKSLNNPKQFPILGGYSMTESSCESEQEIAFSESNYPPLDASAARDVTPDTASDAMPKVIKHTQKQLPTTSNESIDAALSPNDAGYHRTVRYNGIFDPFRDEAVTLSMIAARIKPSVVARVPGKSRFERMFDQGYQVYFFLNQEYAGDDWADKGASAAS